PTSCNCNGSSYNVPLFDGNHIKHSLCFLQAAALSIHANQCTLHFNSQMNFTLNHLSVQLFAQIQITNFPTCCNCDGPSELIWCKPLLLELLKQFQCFFWMVALFVGRHHCVPSDNVLLIAG